MKMLAVSDVESGRYYTWYRDGILKEFDLIVSCGDLKREYLEFLVTMANKPLLYVPGNHDDDFERNPPEGCVPIDGRVHSVQGVRFLGLGGSYRYKKEGKYMYTEEQMRRRIRRLELSLRWHGGVDVLVTHAPARHLNDFDSLSHRGFECFRKLLDRYHPACFIHGHIHQNYGMHIPKRTVYGDTVIYNACEHCEINFPPERDLGPAAGGSR